VRDGVASHCRNARCLHLLPPIPAAMLGRVPQSPLAGQ
jgi:hypothetical protein